MILLTNEVREALFDHAHNGAPAEVCGVLGGRCGSTVHIESVHRIQNVATQPRVEYVVDPEAQLDAMEDIEASGKDVVGFYHSHPNGPRNPSETDAERATWSGFYYVIVVLDDQPSIGAWRWDGERFEREQLTIE